jgi:hypothetical protein
MKRLAVFLLLCALPVALFAQGRLGPEKQRLQQMGLNDAQVTQVLDIQGKTHAALRADAVQLRLLRAQMDKALLPAPASVDMLAVNGFITQMAQVRVDMQKTLVGAQLQLRTILGDDGFRAYMHQLRGRFHRGRSGRTADDGFQGGPGMMSGAGPGMMGDDSQFD